MKEVLETVILNLVEDKDSVSIKQIDGDRSTTFEVRVAEKDMGRVIGKQGRLAKSIRTLMKAAATREHKRVSVEFIG